MEKKKVKNWEKIDRVYQKHEKISKLPLRVGFEGAAYLAAREIHNIVRDGNYEELKYISDIVLWMQEYSLLVKSVENVYKQNEFYFDFVFYYVIVRRPPYELSDTMIQKMEKFLIDSGYSY